MNGDTRKAHVDVDDLTTWEKKQANRRRRREWKHNSIEVFETAWDDIGDVRYDYEMELANKAIEEWCAMYPGESPYKTSAEWDKWEATHK